MSELSTNASDPMAGIIHPAPDQQSETLAEYRARLKDRKRQVEFKEDGPGRANIHATTDGLAQFMRSLGVTDDEFFHGFLRQVMNLFPSDRQGLDFAIGVIKGLEPQDQVEAMLGAQMAAVHSATMKYATKLGHANSLALQESYERTLNRLARTFAAQMAALRQYRTGGTQTMKVEHVTVNDGGQAIVGAFGGGVQKNGGTTA